MVSMGHSKGEIKTLSSDGRSVNAGENMRLGFLTKRDTVGLGHAPSPDVGGALRCITDRHVSDAALWYSTRWKDERTRGNRVSPRWAWGTATGHARRASHRRLRRAMAVEEKRAYHTKASESLTSAEVDYAASQ